MKGLENFVTSDAFFPILILLLVMLVGVFIWVVMSHKKEEKLRREKKQNIVIDESNEVKIIGSNNEEISLKNVIEEDEEEFNNEIAIVEEIAIKKKEIGNMLDDELNLYSYNEIDQNKDDFEEDDKEEVNEVVEEYQDEPIKYSEEEKDEELDLPATKEELISTKEEVINAFNVIPNGESDINEDIVVEYPQEYVGEKTEVFDFPDFNEEEILSSENVEDSIIEAANEYIESIMKK